MSLRYSFKLAVLSLLHEKWINLLSVLTLAAGLLITSITLLSVYNITIATNRLPEKFSVMLYLRENLSQQDIEYVMAAAKREGAVESIRYIPKDEALRDLKNMLKNTEFVLEGLGDNPLPDSLEIRLKKEFVRPETVKTVTGKLKQINGVDEIEYGERFLSSIYSLRFGMKTVGLVFVLIMSVGMIFVCYATVKILFYRREREIETYKLLGATKTFIRAPFLMEGAAIGLCSGLLSLVGMLVLYYLIILKLSLTFPLFHAVVFPVQLFFVLPFIGLFLGLTGGIIAIGRIRY
jgi:cell division transport system permease protein